MSVRAWSEERDHRIGCPIRIQSLSYSDPYSYPISTSIMALVPSFPRSLRERPLSCLVPFSPFVKAFCLFVPAPVWPAFLPSSAPDPARASDSQPHFVFHCLSSLSTCIRVCHIMHPSVENSNIHRRPQCKHKTKKQKKQKTEKGIDRQNKNR